MTVKQSARRSSPQGCLQLTPKAKTIRFGGKFISLSKVAKEAGIDPSYASYIFSGKREGSISVLRAIAKSLGMSLDDFFDSLDDHRSDLEAEYQRRLVG